MSDVLELTLLSGQVGELNREMRLMRLQLDRIVSNTGQLPAQLGSIEQSFHALAGEVSRGFGQMQQQLTRNEKRFDELAAGIAEIRADLAKGANVLAEILAAVKPTV